MGTGMESLPLEMSQKCVDVLLRDTVGSVTFMVELNDLFQL